MQHASFFSPTFSSVAALHELLDAASLVFLGKEDAKPRTNEKQIVFTNIC